ncbi:MAG: hypothetical protein RL760_482 [Candidatus Eisenbacteria bacterium]|jgi:hypothetical protein
MKRSSLVAAVALILVAGAAHASSIGLGVFGGLSVPVVQPDQSNGSTFGVRVPIHVVPMIAVEPFYASTSLGDKTIGTGPVSFTQGGADVTTYGVNAMLSMGGPIRFYPFAGLGSAKYKLAGNSTNVTSYQAGFGLGVTPFPKVSVDLRGELQYAGKSGFVRRNAGITLGASYALFSTIL